METVKLLKPEIVSQNVELSEEVEGECLPCAKIDRKQIKQVFINLIYNALQAMPKGGRLSLKTKFIADSRKIEIVFIDTGQGISSQDFNKIFEPFYTTKPGGTGVGLAVSYNIIKNHHGNIEVRSVPGQGTIFKVYLPGGD